MNKTKLQQELKEKIKEGIKPSDLKKKGKNISQIPTPPASPVIVPVDKKPSKKPGKSNDLPPPIVQGESKKIKELEKDLNFWKTTASNHLSSLQKLTAENDSLQLEIKELKKKPIQLNQAQEEALKEANQKIREQEKENKQWQEVVKKSNLLIADKEQIIKELQSKNNSLIENITRLENQTKTTTNIKETTNKPFFCDGCQLTKQGEYIKRKVDAPFEPRLHGRICYLCPSCSPYVKELNDTNYNQDNNPYKYD